MIRRRMPFAIIFGAVLLVAPVAAAQVAPPTDDEIDAAIEKGCRYLVKLQNPDGSWAPYQHYTHANTVMSMLALAYAGYDPKSAPMRNGIKALLAAEFEDAQTYQTAFRMQAVAKLLRQVDRETRELLLALLKKDAEFLITRQSTIGGWSYNPSPQSGEIGDFSNVQICILGLGEAIKAGLELPPEPLLKTQTLYLDQQLPDGGWHYGRQVRGDWPWTDDEKMPSYGSMTAAGVASLYITRDYLYRGLGCPCQSGRSNYRANKVDDAINRGLKWLGEHYTADANPKSTHWALYWHYSCERVGLASGIKYFGGHNWYAEGARKLLGQQGPEGGWSHRFDAPSRDYPRGSLISPPGTAWAMLFLIKGRAPILMNKLQFDGPWNYHPQDLANLARFVGDTKEQPFAWQVVTLEAPVDEWHDAPILYITPESAIKLSDEQKKKLRTFTDDGGTILFEASCGNPAVRSWWLAAAKDIWPEFEFRLVARDHPVWTADVSMTRRLPGLQEMADGVRSFIFYTPNDLSCAWNTTQITQRGEAFQFGLNLYAYATDRAKIRSRLAGVTGRKVTRAEVMRLKPGPRNALQLALLKHGGDWNVTEHYRPLQKLADRLKDNGGLTLTVAPPAAPADAELPDGALLFATGRVAISLGEPERKALADRLAAGAFLVVDAALGDSRFDQSFRDFAALMKWTLKLLPPDDSIAAGSMGGAAGHKLDDLRFSHHALAKATAPLRLDLHGIYAGDRLVGVYSARDLLYSQAGLRAFGSIAYDGPSAQRIADNIVVYATTR